MKIQFSNSHKNWWFLITLPVVFYLLVEIYFRWPYQKLLPVHQSHYISVTGTLISVFLFTAVTALAVNYWHFRKLPMFISQRRFQLIISIALLCLLYIPAKLLVLGSTMSRELYTKTAGELPDFKMLDKLLSGGMLIFFLFQAAFFAWSLKELRLLKLNNSANG